MSMNEIQPSLGRGCGNANAAHNKERNIVNRGEMPDEIDLRRNGT